MELDMSITLSKMNAISEPTPCKEGHEADKSKLCVKMSSIGIKWY